MDPAAANPMWKGLLAEHLGTVQTQAVLRK